MVVAGRTNRSENKQLTLAMCLSIVRGSQGNKECWSSSKLTYVLDPNIGPLKPFR